MTAFNDAKMDIMRWQVAVSNDDKDYQIIHRIEDIDFPLTQTRSCETPSFSIKMADQHMESSMLGMLLEGKADVDLVDHDGYNALMYAAKLGGYDTVRASRLKSRPTFS